MIQATLIYLFNSRDQILLGMKKRWFWVGKWNWFGGKNKWDETILRTALRELHEEAGILLTPEKIEKAGILHFFWKANPEWNQDVHIFRADHEGDWFETEEMKSQWRDIDKIPYDEMWEDDSIWYPELIAKKFPLDISFTFDENWKLII